MKNFIKVVLINIFALFIVASMLDGVIISSWVTLFFAAVVLSLINIYLKPIIKIIALPVNFLTLGLFTLFINAVLFMFVESLVKGFYIKNFSTAFIGAIILSLIYLLVERFIIVRNKDFYNKQVKQRNINRSSVIDVEGVYEEDSPEENWESKGLEDKK